MDTPKPNAFVFSSKYRVWRHIVFWVVYIIIFPLIYSGSVLPQISFLGELLLTSTIWVVPHILYAYPIMYWCIPQYLLKQKYFQFALILIAWAVAGWFLNYLFRANVLNPFRDYLNFSPTPGSAVGSPNPWSPGSYIIMNMMAGFCCMITLFKYWLKKERDWMQAEKAKITVELQLLKAQVHPHFLFNTLNNIYSFSLESSPKTPELILKLSSLLRYMLYDCKAEQVLLEKEIQVMKNYIDLEKERYGNKIEISLNITGDLKDHYTSPLLLLPFLENAFKHGTSDQLEKPWLSMDLTVKQNTMKCKIANSKNEQVVVSENGIGIQNVKKRLELLYPNKHELKMNNGNNFFVVSLFVELQEQSKFHPAGSLISLPVAQTT